MRQSLWAGGLGGHSLSSGPAGWSCRVLLASPKGHRCSPEMLTGTQVQTLTTDGSITWGGFVPPLGWFQFLDMRMFISLIVPGVRDDSGE